MDSLQQQGIPQTQNGRVTPTISATPDLTQANIKQPVPMESFLSAKSARNLPVEIQIPNGKFLIVSAVDSNRAIEHFAPAVALKTGIPIDDLQKILSAKYEQFTERLFATINELRVGSLGFQALALPSQTLLERMKLNAQGQFTVTLNAGEEMKCDHTLQVSRLHTVSGEYLGMTARPGNPRASEQFMNLKDKMIKEGVTSICLVDDHAWSCRTLEKTVMALSNAGIAVSRIVTLSQVADSEYLRSKGIEILPSCRFVHENSSNEAPVVDSMDIVEARYFLLGANGCVVKLPGGKVGRAPYFLPFADPTKKASIPAEFAQEFSKNVLQYNAEFFKDVSKSLNVVVKVSDGHPDVREALSFHGYNADSEIIGVINDMLENTQTPRARSVLASSRQLQLHALRIPSEILFLDLNGTLILPGEHGIPELLESDLMHMIEKLQDSGLSVGICSDSPLQPLKLLAERLGMRGPVLAENGSIISSRDRVAAVQSLPSSEQIRQAIRSIASRCGYTELPETYALDFSSSVPNFNQSFAFGKGRSSSVSCFADAGLIEHLVGDLKLELARIGVQDALAIDFNSHYGPYGIAIIHPETALRYGKRDALKVLTDYGAKKIWLVGDGASDVIVGNPKVKSYLVGQSPTSELASQAAMATQTKGVVGAIELMRAALREYENGPV